MAGESLAQFLRWFDLIGLQRHIKVLGIFARLYWRDGKTGYLADLPRTLRYVQEVAHAWPELAQFAQFADQRLAPGTCSSQCAGAGCGASMKAMLLAAGRGERMRGP